MSNSHIKQATEGIEEMKSLKELILKLKTIS